MKNYEALYHMTPQTKVFAFITSQYEFKHLVCEYFLLIFGEDNKFGPDGLTIHYGEDALKLMCPEGNFEEYGMKETISQATDALLPFFTDVFCKQMPSGDLDPRCRITTERPLLTPATLAVLIRSPLTEKELRFVYQTRNKELLKFLQNILLAKKYVSLSPFGKEY